MKLSSFFGTVRLIFFPKFLLLFLPSIFDILQQNGCSKNPKAPFFTFFGIMRLTENLKKIRKKFGIFFSIFTFLRAFVVSSCRKSGFRFRVFLSLRYGADLGRSRFFRLTPNRPNLQEATKQFKR